MTWRKSTYSGGASNNCVEVGSDSGVLVRDTKDSGTGPVLAFAPATWSDFLATLK